MALRTARFGDAKASTWRTLVRHQLGAVLAAIIDFVVMIFCVQRAGLTPVQATSVGAGGGCDREFRPGSSVDLPQEVGRFGLPSHPLRRRLRRERLGQHTGGTSGA
jgi:hypothetical protein